MYLDLNNITKQIHQLTEHLQTTYQHNVVDYLDNILNSTHEFFDDDKHIAKDVINPTIYCINDIKTIHHLNRNQKYHCFLLDIDNTHNNNFNKWYDGTLSNVTVDAHQYVLLFLFSCMMGIFLCSCYTKKNKKNKEIKVIGVEECKEDEYNKNNMISV